MRAVVVKFSICAAFLLPLISNSLIQPKISASSKLSLSLSHRDNTDLVEREKIVIVGGGFGGIYAAVTLCSIPWEKEKKPMIQLIDNKERFVFLPLLYELCVGDASLEEVAPTFKSLLRNLDVDFLQGEVTSIDVANNALRVSRSVDGMNTVIEGDVCVKYDKMILATGREADISSVKGASEVVKKFYTLDDCYDLRRQLNLLQSKKKELGGNINIVVVGGGFSGVELALNLVSKGNVFLIHRGKSILPGASDYNRENALKRLKIAGVRVQCNTNVLEIVNKSSSFGKYRILTNNEKETLGDLIIWTAGSVIPNNKGVQNSILPRDRNGRIVTGPLLRVKGYENIFAIGDVSRARKEPYQATAQVAMQQATVAAWNVYQTIENQQKKIDKPLLSFRYLDLGQMMTLGSDDATIKSLGGSILLNGPSASALRRLIYAFRMPTWTQRFEAGFSFLKNK